MLSLVIGKDMSHQSLSVNAVFQDVAQLPIEENYIDVTFFNFESLFYSFPWPCPTSLAALRPSDLFHSPEQKSKTAPTLGTWHTASTYEQCTLHF